MMPSPWMVLLTLVSVKPPEDDGIVAAARRAQRHRAPALQRRIAEELQYRVAATPPIHLEVAVVGDYPNDVGGAAEVARIRAVERHGASTGAPIQPGRVPARSSKSSATHGIQASALDDSIDHLHRGAVGGDVSSGVVDRIIYHQYSAVGGFQ